MVSEHDYAGFCFPLVGLGQHSHQNVDGPLIELLTIFENEGHRTREVLLKSLY